MYNHVLIPVDCSDTCRRDAVQLARYVSHMNGTLVTIAAGITPSIDPRLHLKKIQHAQTALAAIGGIMDQVGVRTRKVIVEGSDIARALANEAYSVDEQYDAFLVGVHHTVAERDDFPCQGSLADQIAQRTHLPVVILSGEL